MALAPEFFALLGIVVFLAMSLLSALLERDLPSRLQYIFQGAAAGGLGVLLISPVFVDPSRFRICIAYLATALSSVVGLNAYLVVAHRRAIASAFSGAVTAPIVMISVLFIFSYMGSGDVSLSPAAILTITVSVLVASLSVFGFMREASKHLGRRPIGRGPTPTTPVPASPGPVSTPAGILGVGSPSNSSSMKGEDLVELLKKEMGEK